MPTLPKPRSVDVTPRRRKQALGRKGLETRGRLMAAADVLLQTVSPVSLSIHAIARQAGTSPATFYVYFDDVSDVVLALAQEASTDLGEIMDALARWRAGLETEAGARAFMAAYQAYWARHRAILVTRNMEADRGDPRFLATRSEAGMTIVRQLAQVIQEGHPAGQLDDEQAIARATVMFAAIERLAAATPLYPRTPQSPTEAALNEAQIAILASLVRN